MPQVNEFSWIFNTIKFSMIMFTILVFLSYNFEFTSNLSFKFKNLMFFGALI